MNLKTTVNTLLGDFIRMCEGEAGTEKLSGELAIMLERLNEPLRVAVVGVMKAGKSTLLNAIMREKILITGIVETTYITSWFKYGEIPALIVVFKNGETICDLIENLALWTARENLTKNPKMNDVAYVEIYYPNEVLKRIEIIDTPGLSSTIQTDAENTLNFLGLSQKEKDDQIAATETTMLEASKADAIIYAFARTAQTGDRDVLEAFQGGGAANTTPMNAVGVLTKADANWMMLEECTPLEKTAPVSKSMMQNPALKSLIYTIKPVCAILAEGAGSLTEENWITLEKLSKLDEETFLALLSDANTFSNISPKQFEELMEAPLSEEQRRDFCTSEQRNAVYRILSQYGVYLAVQALRTGKSYISVQELLYQESGIQEVLSLILNHFGNHAFLLKLNYVFLHLNAVASERMRKADENSGEYRICEAIREGIRDLQDTQQVFKEMNLLKNYYNGLLVLKNEEENQQLMQITGEYGANCEAKLGVLEGRMSIRELAVFAQKKAVYWGERENDIPITRYYKQAAQVLSRSYGILQYHLESLLGE